MVERIRTLLETRQLTPTQFADAIGVARPIVSHILSGRNKPSLEVVQRILAAMPDLSMPWLLNGTGSMLASAVPMVPATPTVPATPVAAVPPAPAVGKEGYLQPVVAESSQGAFKEGKADSKGPSKKQGAGPARPMPRRFTASASKLPSSEDDGAALDAASDAASSAALSPSGALRAAPLPSLATVEEKGTEPRPTSHVTASAQEQTPSSESIPVANTTAATLFAGAEKPIRRIVIFYRDGSFADYQPE
jgi:transcriptional regulator with XRE-family HTH domain